MLKLLKRMLPSTLKRITPVRAYIASFVAPQFVGYYTNHSKNKTNNETSEKEKSSTAENKAVDSTRVSELQV